jgi:Holliday junction resolvase RusA-like endonuclease
LEAYHAFLAYSLPSKKIPKGKLSVRYEFGVSSKGSDGDNLIKCFQDALARKYGFNDNQIYRWEVEKKIVVKGKEYISFDIFAAKKK